MRSKSPTNESVDAETVTGLIEMAKQFMSKYKFIILVMSKDQSSSIEQSYSIIWLARKVIGDFISIERIPKFSQTENELRQQVQDLKSSILEVTKEN